MCTLFCFYLVWFISNLITWHLMCVDISSTITNVYNAKTILEDTGSSEHFSSFRWVGCFSLSWGTLLCDIHESHDRFKSTVPCSLKFCFLTSRSVFGVFLLCFIPQFQSSCHRRWVWNWQEPLGTFAGGKTRGSFRCHHTDFNDFKCWPRCKSLKKHDVSLPLYTDRHKYLPIKEQPFPRGCSQPILF